MGATLASRGLPFTITASVDVQINNTTKAINETFKVGTGSTTLVLPAGPYIRLEVGTTTPLVLTILDQSLTGIFVSSRSHPPAPTACSTPRMTARSSRSPPALLG